MSYGYMRNASTMYQTTRAAGSVEGADPHQLTLMLLDGAIERINQGLGCMRVGNVAGKGEKLSKAVAIVGELRDTLDLKAGGELAVRLNALYDYVTRRLLHAQLNDDGRALEETVRLLTPVRDGWSGIRDEYLKNRQGAAA